MPLAQKKILIVDDEKAIADLIAEFCVFLGHHTRAVYDSESALKAAKDYRPDLITLDLMMPKMNGFEVMALLKNDPETAGIPVIILSAIVNDNPIKELIKACKFTLAKPVKLHVLKEKINHAIFEHSMSDPSHSAREIR